MPANHELSEAFDHRPVGHHYSFGRIQLVLRLILSAIGYRASARVLEILAPLLPEEGSPSANVGQLWLLRMGLYEIERTKEQADDWIWLIDHTLQTGNGKCFVVFGIRLSDWEAKRREALAADPEASFSLQHQDLSAFAIERMDSSTGLLVHEQLEHLAETTGITPRAILSDQGSDVRLGAELFCRGEHRQTILLHDIAHAVACAIKRQLQDDARWTQFLAEANHCKTRIRQTPYAFLVPPDLKNKARWMNLEPLIAWSRRVLDFLDDPQPALAAAEVPVDLATLDEKLGWLRGHADSIGRWENLMAARTVVLNYIRNAGYHEQAPSELQTLLANFREEPTRAVVEEVLEFVRGQCASCAGRRLLGSTEVLESLIGKGKQLQGANKNGYTKTILGLAASVVETTRETITAAFARIKVQDVSDWIEANLGLSLPAQRQRALTARAGTKAG